MGYAIGRTLGTAVVRNRVKRRLRAAVATANMPLTSGFYVISADATAATVPFASLVASLESAAAAL